MRALSFEDYERLSEAGRLVPVFREIPGDLLTPVSAFLRTGAERDRSLPALTQLQRAGDTLRNQARQQARVVARSGSLS